MKPQKVRTICGRAVFCIIGLAAAWLSVHAIYTGQVAPNVKITRGHEPVAFWSEVVFFLLVSVGFFCVAFTKWKVQRPIDIRWPFLKVYHASFVTVVCFLAVAGMVTIFWGSLEHVPQIMRVGTGLFLSSVAIFFLGVGGQSLSVILKTAQTCGFRVIKEQPLYSVSWFLFSLFLVLLGIGLECMIVRGYFLR